jgi:outer membrane protein OmpA-like peptidoglycan-associated protein
VIGLGIAIFTLGRTLATQGSLSFSSQDASHVFPNTPLDTPRKRSTMDFRICAHHPRYGIGTQYFYFRLSIEHNGHDVLLSSIQLQRDRSSSLQMSTFHADFVPKNPPDQPVNDRATIRYLIRNGQWDPVGRGDVSFSGELLIGPDGAAMIDIESEQGWVYVEQNPWSNVQRVAIPTPTKRTESYEIFFDPPGSDAIVAGTDRGLLDWYDGLSEPLRRNVEAGATPVTLWGHASTTGTDDANRKLARRRGEAVRAILADPLGPSAKLEIRAIGERASGPDAVEDRKWRKVRVEIVHF